MSPSPSCKLGLSSLLLLVLMSYSAPSLSAQALSSRPVVSPPSPLAVTPTSAQQQALQNLTSAQSQAIQNVIRPKLQQAMQSHQASAVGSYRTWQDIIQNGTPKAQVAAQGAQSTRANEREVQVYNESGSHWTELVSTREYHPAAAASAHATQAIATPNLGCCHPISNPDQDGDGLPDAGDGLESQLAYEFRPYYFISSGEQQQFATFASTVPWTVVSTVGTNPPTSYTHVSPLGLGKDNAGNPVFAVRVDFLSLLNADGGLIGGGGACFYSYFGLDAVINQLSGHALDAERSVMLLAAPAVNGSYNPDASTYKLYSLYTAAHEGTFFDQSLYTDFSTPVPAGNHVSLPLSLSKHSTYPGFDPNYYPITPAWFIFATNEAITTAYAAGTIDIYTYLATIAAADDTFYGCLVERFGNQGPDSISYPVFNVGEVSHPLNGFNFIQDNSARALGLASKLTNPVF